MQDLLKNWWRLQTSTADASRENAILMEAWLEGYEEYAMEQVGWICRLVGYDWREVLELETLYLQYKKLPTLPAEIGNLQGLGTLYLRNNNLTTLPAEIGNLQVLSWVDLRYNPISKTEQQRIRSLLPNCKISFSFQL